jgi:hypothetical protein
VYVYVGDDKSGDDVGGYSYDDDVTLVMKIMVELLMSMIIIIIIKQ